jgi:hypothetical protein
MTFSCIPIEYGQLTAVKNGFDVNCANRDGSDVLEDCGIRDKIGLETAVDGAFKDCCEVTDGSSIPSDPSSDFVAPGAFRG